MELDLSIDFTSIYLLLKLERLIKKRNQIKAEIKKEMYTRKDEMKKEMYVREDEIKKEMYIGEDEITEKTHSPKLLNEIKNIYNKETKLSNSTTTVYKKCDLMPKNMITRITFPEDRIKPKSGENIWYRDEMCDICGKLIKRQNMEFHINAHYKRRPYVCPFDYCKRSFGSPSLLVCHRRIHSGEKKFPCDLCPKKFHFRTDLRKHKIIHSEPKFECIICNNKFKSKHRLKYHMKIHQEPENLLCTVKSCGKTFKNSKTLRTHLRTCHKIRIKFPVPLSK